MNSAGHVTIWPDWRQRLKSHEFKIHDKFGQQSDQELAGFTAGFPCIISRQKFFFRRSKFDPIQNLYKCNKLYITLEKNIFKPK